MLLTADAARTRTRRRVQGCAGARGESFWRAERWRICARGVSWDADVFACAGGGAETIRVSISSPVAPWQVYDVPLEPGALRWIREREGLGDAWREEDYVCEQRWAASEDGTQVPPS
eukprot:1761428-Rhodomonas_salina.2